MPFTAYFSLLLVIINVIVSYKGINSSVFFDRYCFDTEKILVEKDYKRLITSGFLHLNWLHLIFNMYSLYVFSTSLEVELGSLLFIIVYLASLLGGNLLSLYIHRNDSSYRAAGASGAVSGVIFASIAIFPGIQVGIFPLPFYIYGWLYGLAYILYSIYGIGKKRGNIGHAAHLGGALSGVIAAILVHPSSLIENYTAIILISLPCIIFLYLIATRPHLLLKDNMFSRSQPQKLTIDQRYNAEKKMQQQELDNILDKIHRKGMESLSRSEREKLEKFTR